MEVVHGALEPCDGALLVHVCAGERERAHARAQETERDVCVRERGVGEGGKGEKKGLREEYLDGDALKSERVLVALHRERMLCSLHLLLRLAQRLQSS